MSVVTMMDSGGHSGTLRDNFGVLPPGDARRCLVALSQESELLRDLFSFRFQGSPLEGHSFGNLCILALTKVVGSEREAFEAIARILKIRGRVVPVTWVHTHLNAELEDGQTVLGEANIDARGRLAIEAANYESLVPIRRVYLDPEAEANPDALAAIRNSEAIVLAPGDLFTSTLPNLLAKGISETIRETRSPFVYIANLMTKHGETDGWTASRHVSEIVRYCGRIPDAVLAHEGEISTELVRKYETESSRAVEVDVERLYDMGVQVVRLANLADVSSFVRHDSVETAKALLRLLDEVGDSANQLPPRRRIV